MLIWLINICCWLLLVSCSLDAARPSKVRRKWGQQSYGHNMCVSERVIGSSVVFGRPWTGGQLCDKTTVSTIDCCEGYSKMDGEPGCAAVEPFGDIMECLNKTGVSQFLKKINDTIRMNEILVNQGPFTVFAPIDDPDETDNDNRSGGDGPLNPVWAYHVVRGRISDKDFTENQLLPTLVPNRMLRINKFKSGLLTVNCVPLVQLNREATNGMVHTIQRSLYDQAHESLADVVSREPELSILSSALSKVKLNSIIRDSTNVFTLFAPTNTAFQSMSRQDFEAIFAQPDTLHTLLRNHLIKEAWCSTAVVSRRSFWSLEGAIIKVSCNRSATYVNNAAIVRRDLVATNGFVQVIDKVLIHKKVRSLLQIIQDLQLTQLHQMVTSSPQLMDVFVNGAQFTLFAPTNEALEAGLRVNVSAYDFVVGHMVTGKHLTVDFVDEMPLANLMEDMKPLQVKLYPRKIMIDGAVIVQANHAGRNGVVHVIDRTIERPSMTIGQFMQQQHNLSVFINALNHTTSRLLDELTEDEVGRFTVFAPDDWAFDQLPYFALDRMLLDDVILNDIMENHVLDEEVLTSGLLPKAYYSFRSRSGHVFRMREDAGVVTAAIAIITRADIRCKNGVLHIVDRLIQFG